MAQCLAMLEAADFAAEVLQATLGGQRVRIRTRSGYPEKLAAELGRLLRQGVPPDHAFRELGVPRSTGYRLLKRRDSPT